MTSSFISRILLSSSKLSVLPERNTGTMLPPLKEGQVFPAKVLQSLSGRRAQLLLLGKTITAKTHAPLQHGETIRLRVIKSAPTPVFKIETAEPSATRQIADAVQALGRTGPFKHVEELLKHASAAKPAGRSGDPFPAASRLARLVQSSSLQSDSPRENFLPRLIQTSGLQWENKIFSFLSRSADFAPAKIQELIETDLKGLALEASRRNPEAMENQGHSPRLFAKGIEDLQLFNHQIWEETGKLLLHLPILFGGTITFGQLLIDLNRSREEQHKENRTTRISFLLEMTRIGEIMADFSLLDNRITGSFGVVDADTRDLILSHLPILTDRLTAHGFVVHPLTCRVLGPETLAGTSLVEKILSGSDESLVSILI